MWARAFRLAGIIVASVVFGYLIGSNGIQPQAVTPPTSGFLVADLSIQPAEARPNEIVTISVSVANTHDTWGISSLVLKINGIKEAEKQANVDAGSRQDVSFSVRRENPGSYSVFINGLSGSFAIVAPPSR